MSNIDPPRLSVQPVTTPPPSAEPQQKYDFFYNGSQRVNFCGFNLFAELVGAPPNTPDSLDLWGPNEGSATPDETPPQYGMRYAQYFDRLKAAKINYLRIFIFNPQKVRVYPFVKENLGQGLKYSLDKVAPTFIARLKDFVNQARARGIVVCISLFSNQALSGPEREGDTDYAWLHNPFKGGNNNNNLLFDSMNHGRRTFCVIRKPPEPDEAYNPAWPVPQRLYWIQLNFVREVVNATKPFWNVMYEIFNEPNPNITEVVPWHVKVGQWLNGLLRDASTGRRTRLVGITADDRLLDTSPLLDRLLPATGPKLIDFFSLHGGGGFLASQWGGPHGRGRPNVCRQATAPTRAQIVNGADEQYTDPRTGEQKTVHHRGILDAISRFDGRPMALIFDSDAQYWTQKLPAPYLEELLKRDGSFVYRWGDDLIHHTDDRCTPTSPLRFGLQQRLDKITAANFRDRITVF